MFIKQDSFPNNMKRPNLDEPITLYAPQEIVLLSLGRRLGFNVGLRLTATDDVGFFSSLEEGEEKEFPEPLSLGGHHILGDVDRANYANNTLPIARIPAEFKYKGIPYRMQTALFGDIAGQTRLSHQEVNQVIKYKKYSWSLAVSGVDEEQNPVGSFFTAIVENVKSKYGLVEVIADNMFDESNCSIEDALCSSAHVASLSRRLHKFAQQYPKGEAIEPVLYMNQLLHVLVGKRPPRTLMDESPY